jgi:NAD(P)-dependent dehydrogenase (short-subunit alcohol dehydrogenase family)
MMSQEVGKVMRDQGEGGIIITITSVGGHVALRTGVAATKAALIQMTKVLALEWGQYNINVNAIGPWYFRTPLTEKLLDLQGKPFLGFPEGKLFVFTFPLNPLEYLSAIWKK